MSAITPREALFGVPLHKRVILKLGRFWFWLGQELDGQPKWSWWTIPIRAVAGGLVIGFIGIMSYAAGWAVWWLVTNYPLQFGATLLLLLPGAVLGRFMLK